MCLIVGFRSLLLLLDGCCLFVVCLLCSFVVGCVVVVCSLGCSLLVVCGLVLFAVRCDLLVVVKCFFVVEC